MAKISKRWRRTKDAEGKPIPERDRDLVGYEVRYRDRDGKRRAKLFRKLKDADAYLVQVRADLAKGLHVAPGASITVSDAGDLWLERAQKGDVKRDPLERSTVRQYRQHLELHIKPELGSVKLNDLTTPRVSEFIDGLLETRSRALTRKVVTSLGSIISESVRRGLAAHNPVSSFEIGQSTGDQDEIEMPTRDELRAILNMVKGRWRPLIVTAAFTGMRASELRGLPWEHVDFEASKIRVRQRADAWGNFGPPKSKAGKRDIPMAPIVANTLREWKLACPKGDDNPLNLVFPSPAGAVLAHAVILRDGFGPVQAAAGVTVPATDEDGKPLVDGEGNPVLEPKFGLHALRHAACAMFIEQGWSPKKVQTVMGHASIKMTYDVYGYLFSTEEDDQAAMTQIEARLLK